MGNFRINERHTSISDAGLGKIVFFFCLLILGLSDANAENTNKTGSLNFDGQNRTYLVHVPSLQNRTRPMPLVIVLHGGGGSGRNMVKLSQGEFDQLSDKEGFVVVYPDGVDKHWNDGRSGKETGYGAHQKNLDDVGFISALIDELIAKRGVDPQRVYVTGMSNGAMMTYRLGCDLAGKIAAIAPVAGNIPQNLVPSCSPSRPVAVLAINNDRDPLMPFDGGDVTGPFGRKKLGKVLSAHESVKFWAKYNRCSLAPQVSYEPDRDPEDGTRIRKEVYGGCRNNTEVVLYIVEGGGHTWPGGYQYLKPRLIGLSSRDMDASAVILDFFKRHPAR